MCFDLSVRECLYSTLNVMPVGMLWEILYATASASMCVLGLEMWHSMNTNSLWLMGWTGFIRPMNIKRIVWPFLPLPLDHLHKNKSENRIDVCFTLSWTGEVRAAVFSFIFIYFSPLEAVALVLSESSNSQSDCRAHVKCKDTAPFLAFIKGKRPGLCF